MELAKKFKEASDCQLLRIDQLIIDQEYSIQKAMRVPTNNGGIVMIYLRCNRDLSNLYKVYMPIHYADVVSDKDIEEINTEKIWINLVYRGLKRDVSVILAVT
jgi:hypothetical protein